MAMEHKIKKHNKDIRWQKVHALKIRNYAKLTAIRHLKKNIEIVNQKINDYGLILCESRIYSNGRTIILTEQIVIEIKNMIIPLNRKQQDFKNEINTLSSLIDVERKEQSELIAKIKKESEI